MERIKIELSRELTERVSTAARSQGDTPHAYAGAILEQHVPPLAARRPDEGSLPRLVQFLGRIPAVRVLSSGNQSGRWWVKFDIDIGSPLAWHVVQELGFVLNHISLTELLPTVFKPVSPPPYLNGGPRECLGWVIESTAAFVDPAAIAKVMEDRMPSPVDDLSQWTVEE